MKKPSNKLTLRSETIRQLTGYHLEGVNGGASVSIAPSTGVSITPSTSVITPSTSVIIPSTGIPSGGIPSGGSRH